MFLVHGTREAIVALYKLTDVTEMADYVHSAIKPIIYEKCLRMIIKGIKGCWPLVECKAWSIRSPGVEQCAHKLHCLAIISCFILLDTGISSGLLYEAVIRVFDILHGSPLANKRR